MEASRTRAGGLRRQEREGEDLQEFVVAGERYIKGKGLMVTHLSKVGTFKEALATWDKEAAQKEAKAVGCLGGLAARLAGLHHRGKQINPLRNPPGGELHHMSSAHHLSGMHTSSMDQVERDRIRRSRVDRSSFFGGTPRVTQAPP